MTERSRFVSLKDGAEYSGLSESLLRRMLKDGRLRACRPTGTDRLLLDKEELIRVVRGESVLNPA